MYNSAVTPARLRELFSKSQGPRKVLRATDFCSAFANHVLVARLLHEYCLAR